MDRIAFINGLIGRPYKLGGQGPDAFDCYGLTRFVQRELFGRAMPEFVTPERAGLQAIAGFIQAHPERRNWRRIDGPVDGAIVSMFREGIGHHMGTYLDIDRGMVLHTLGGEDESKSMGVVVDTLFRMKAPPKAWTAFHFYLPRD